MNRSRSSRTEQLDLRVDSPMQEDSDLSTPTSARDGRISESPAPRTNVSSSGFTAVNGSRHGPLIRPHVSAHASSVPPNGEQVRSSRAEPARLSAGDRTLSWRPGDHEDTDRGAHLNKRKRTDSTGHEARHDNPSDTAGANPHRKRPNLTHVPTSRCSPERPSVEGVRRGVGTAMIPTYARSYQRATIRRRGPPWSSTQPLVLTADSEPSPDSTRWNNGEPPTPPRPDIEAGLAESIQRDHLSLKTQAGKQPGPSGGPTCPRAEASTPNPVSASPEAEVQESSPSGPRPGRKRNFSNRTKTGCHTCRARKKKCDEGKPHCQNCLRGDFYCRGYGPKQPEDDKVLRVHPYAQRQHQYESTFTSVARPQPPSNPPSLHARLPSRRDPTPTQYYPQPESTHRPPGLPNWDRPNPRRDEKYRQVPRYSEPVLTDHRQPSSGRDNWSSQVGTVVSDHRPPGDYHPPLPMVSYSSTARPPPHEPWPRPNLGPQYPAPNVAGTVISVHDSVTTSSSGGSQQVPLTFNAEGGLSERSKMITGLPYRHFLDDELIRDRQSCKRAVESYNDAARALSTLSPAEKERLFRMVIDPPSRVYDGDQALRWSGPKGTCGARTIVESPFTCEYGYNLHFGDDVVISQNCQMQDACDIYIGNRTVVGPNAKFYCITADLDPSVRKGSQGNFKAGPIKVEEDAYIGADAIILPFRTIGRGATVGAGSVVTEDVKPYTVVAGNPAKVLRRIGPGQCDERHAKPDIQEQNERLLQRMQSGLNQGFRDRFI